MTVSAWLIPLAAAALVAFGNFMVQRWRYRIDRTGISVDHLCAELNSAADLAATYWLLDATQDADRPEARRLEPQLVGRQMRLQELTIALGEQDRGLDLADFERSMPDLYEVMTGGDFRVERCPSSPERAQRVQATAAQLNGQLRRCLGARSHRWW
jgi:hypothetical protein